MGNCLARIQTEPELTGKNALFIEYEKSLAELVKHTYNNNSIMCDIIKCDDELTKEEIEVLLAYIEKNIILIKNKLSFDRLSYQRLGEIHSKKIKKSIVFA